MEEKTTNKPAINFYGGVGTATGANIGLAFGGRNILVDCGLLQGLKPDEEKNFENFKYDPKLQDFLLITHAHMDHIGKIPKLVRDGFQGKIFSTNATKEIARPMLEDAFRVMQSKNPDHLLYQEKDIEESFKLWQGFNYEEEINLSENCKLKMTDAGHILGSAILNLDCQGDKEKTKFAFTGDLGNSPSPLLPDTKFVKDARYIIMESVYGDRNHEEKKERREKLKQYILEGIKRDGTIIIPAFSIERTQVLLYELNNLVENKEIPNIPIYLDSPLAEKVTEIYKNHTELFKEEAREQIKSGDDIFSFPNLEIVKTHNESVEIEMNQNPKIILAGSGMSSGGRVVNHEIAALGGKENTIILVGYQSIGTLGRQLQEGLKEVMIGLKKVKVNAKIENITGYSSHADSDHLLEFVAEAGESGKLKKVFVIMGEPKSSLFLVQKIRDNLGIEAIYPEEGKSYEL